MVERDFDGSAELLRALAHAVRLQILCTIKDEEHSVGEIEELAGVSQPGLSQQLAILRKAGLVQTRREGKQVFYKVEREQMIGAANLLGALAGTSVPMPDEPVLGGSRPRGGAASFAKVTR